MVHRDVEESPAPVARCRSMVSTRLTPAALSKLATSLAVIGTRGWSLRSWRAYPKKRNHGRDPIRAGAPRCIDHDQQFHQVLIGWRTSRLNVKTSCPRCFPRSSRNVRHPERAESLPARGDADVFANPLGQISVGRAGEDFQFWLKRKHRERLT